MKKFQVISALLILFLLNGCFSGNNDRSGLPDPSALRETVEEERMTELKQNRCLRLGVPSGVSAPKFQSLEKLCAEKGWKLQIISCQKEWLTGFLRAGKLDLIYVPDLSAKRGESMGFHSLSGGLLIRNEALFQYLTEP